MLHTFSFFEGTCVCVHVCVRAQARAHTHKQTFLNLTTRNNITKHSAICEQYK